MSELNEFFENARRYEHARDAKLPDFKEDLKLEAIIPVIEGKEPILVIQVTKEIRSTIFL